MYLFIGLILILIYNKGYYCFLLVFIFYIYRSLDTFIGRAAHILFLESNFLLREIVYKYD